MKKEVHTTPPKNKNKSADYYSRDVYNYGSVYGINEVPQTHNPKDTKEQPVESWGWNNSTD